MTSKVVALLAVLFLHLPDLVCPVAAQTTATLRGLVRDAQGAPIAGATITVRAGETGLSRSVPTAADGSFVIVGLPPATVDVEAAATGFAGATRQGIVLQVGQTTTVEMTLAVAGVRETVAVRVVVPLLNTSTSVVDAVITSAAIEALPLNGRNFLELALLVPGNVPAPNFDPTKSNSVVIASAGHLGRGGNITIDGADNNDDVVGGPLQNVTEESVQEFQIATARFSAESGRSGSSIINVVTKSGGDQFRGSASLFARDRRWQGLPATYDRRSGDTVPFDRQQIAGAAGGPLSAGRAFWFGAAEYRQQDGAVLVGARDVASRTIRRSFAPAPLDDLLASGRADWRPSEADRFAFHYAGQRAEDTGASTLDRAIGSASYRQRSRNTYGVAVGSWSRLVNPATLNVATVSFSSFDNDIAPVASGPQLTFPSILDGSSFRVPQGTTQTRLQIANTFYMVRGDQHVLRVGGEWKRVNAAFDLGVFQDGRIEFVEDFATFDHNGDGRVDDGDLLFAVTLRSGKPDQALVLPDADNDYVAVFVQDDWRVHASLTLNLGLRYEIDSDVKNISRVGDINPLVQPFLEGTRRRDRNNLGPRIGFNWAPDGRTSVYGGYGIYYDRVTLQIQSLERGLDGRALPIEVRAGNVFFLDEATGRFPPFAPSVAAPFTGFILPGAGASGINIIDNRLQNPSVQQWHLGVQRELPWETVLSVDGVHTLGTHFIIGRTIGEVFNPVVGGPDRVVNLESSVNTHYDALLVSLRRSGARAGFRAGYTFAKALNYANDDQIPFANGPVDPTNLRLEYGPTPNDQRHRFTMAAWLQAPGGVLVAPMLTLASGVPMDILMPDGQMRVPVFQRNAGGRQFETGADLNRAIAAINAQGGVNGQPLPSVRDDLRLGDGFSSLDLRISRAFDVGRVRLEPMLEVFNVFNVTNILGVSVKNYSGFNNVLVRDHSDPREPGYLRSSTFGDAVSTAGGVFGSGGPRAFQFGVRARF